MEVLPARPREPESDRATFFATALLFVCAAFAPPLSAQILINRFAGGAVRSYVPAQNVWLDIVSGLTWGPRGAVVFTDTTNNIIRLISSDGTLGTIAGEGVPGFTGDGTPAMYSLINTPLAPRYDAAGNLYFVDSGNHRIRRIDTGGIITTVAGDGIPYVSGMDFTGPATQRSLPYIGDIEVSPGGNVYFTDTIEQGSAPPEVRIRVVTTDGKLQILAVLPSGLYYGFTIDGAGNRIPVSPTITLPASGRVMWPSSASLPMARFPRCTRTWPAAIIRSRSPGGT